SFFFFQAEDGIRDKLVTGVQTCALPISGPPPWPPCSSNGAGSPPPRRRTSNAGCGRGSATGGPPAPPRTPRRGPRSRSAGRWRRSEERRVGKECRCGWSRECENENDEEG